jgi:hypothetical protein
MVGIEDLLWAVAGPSLCMLQVGGRIDYEELQLAR